MKRANYGHQHTLSPSVLNRQPQHAPCTQSLASPRPSLKRQMLTKKPTRKPAARKPTVSPTVENTNYFPRNNQELMESSSGAGASAPLESPQKVQMIKDLLVSMGVEDADPKVSTLAPSSSFSCLLSCDAAMESSWTRLGISKNTHTAFYLVC